MIYDAERALELLRLGSGRPDAAFREGQEEAIRRDEVDMLLVSPERLANERFRDEVLAEIADRIARLVIDEAHCISDWGHDFRPHYRLLERIVATLPPNLRLLATTATANDRVMEDLAAVLGPDLAVSRGDLQRPSLALQAIRLPSQAERLAWLAQHVPALPAPVGALRRRRESGVSPGSPAAWTGADTRCGAWGGAFSPGRFRRDGARGPSPTVWGTSLRFLSAP